MPYGFVNHIAAAQCHLAAALKSRTTLCLRQTELLKYT